MKPTKIEWTQASWNPSIGCDKISEGCRNCYAEIMAKRLQAIGNLDYKDGFKFKMLPHRLNDPLQNKKPTLYFVNSMSDLFHEKMDFNFLDQIMNTIKQTPYHQYQILTKKPSKMRKYFLDKKILNNIWLGVTIESKQVKKRIDLLRDLPAKIKWLSCEPLLNDLGNLNLSGIDWVVVGGESGSSARMVKKEWIVNIQRQCKEQNTAFFFKQWGTYGEDGIKRNKKENGALLNGKIFRAFPNKQ
ncbi:TPA: phage Gp37/Gp68 family protein [Campylobacter jejuni]|nr:phage Gp37/Gp68 family protein [Campylobacter jejuni]HDZ5136013.1 phage Gp37/Gp68 family protein [Campylobacter jejuni]HDZ5141893.1 phage Gp37/Gp68 family protein [Campylobacter jejuni]HDZ5142464.1 phage Gp37/Gp68 family protein [Campylobacter jejuni]HDZ5148178.1 phage Gp37/Gp68 family protein [Campylobacter jejuni]